LAYAAPERDAHTLVWGGEVRHGSDRLTPGTPYLAMLPARLDQT